LVLSGVPVSVGILWKSEAEARKAPAGDFRLIFCEACSYVWNDAYDARNLSYAPGYEISLHFSPIYRDFLATLAQSLVAKYHLQRKTVLEIACGKGEFLRMLCAAGAGRGIGVDPSIEHAVMEKLGVAEIDFRRQDFSEDCAAIDCDFICCRQALHMIPDPSQLVELVWRAAGRRHSTPVYFEVVNGGKLLARQSVWQLIYEHCSFFTDASLTALFARRGFEVEQAGACYEDGQYLQIEAHPAAAKSSRLPAKERVEAIRADVIGFADGVKQKVSGWEQKLTQFSDAGRRVMAWGAGGRGSNFLNLIRASRNIRYIVDINPDRQGLHVPGTGQQIVPPAFVREYRPDLMILTNPTYETEVRQELAALGVACDLVTVS
jgi:SAM-dependent methyltransferase